MHIKYMFIVQRAVQRYGLMPAVAAGFAPRMWSLWQAASGWGAAIRRVWL